jgi:glycosyltransferase involved in cell wall biosynthesis
MVGPAAARNLGPLPRASGDFIAFLDSDDLWEPEKLARQMDEFRAPSGDRARLQRSDDVPRGGGERTASSAAGILAIRPCGSFSLETSFPNSTVIVRRDCDRSTVGRLNESRDLIGVEDYEYWMRIALQHRLRGSQNRSPGTGRGRETLMGAGRRYREGAAAGKMALESIASTQIRQIWKRVR